MVPELRSETKETYLQPGKPDGLELLAPPPVAAEQAADLACAQTVFRARTPAEEAHAIKSATLAFSLFQPAIGSWFNLEKLPKVSALLQQVKQETGPVIEHCKNHWQRSRPYQVDPTLVFGKGEKSFSYPSGHSTRGALYSLVIAEIFPEKKEAILAIGRQIGWDRVLIGKHFPTDVNAGRVLARAILRELQASEEFKRDLAEARAEVEAFHAPPAPVGAAALN